MVGEGHGRVPLQHLRPTAVCVEGPAHATSATAIDDSGEEKRCQRPGSSTDEGVGGLSPEATGREDGEGERDEEGEDGRLPRRITTPFTVTHEEKEQHELTHTPYRSWCRHCVRARGRNEPHRSREEEQRRTGVPRVSMDYFFMSKEDEQAHSNPLIVMLDEETGEKYARVVGQKGVGGAGDMDWLIRDMSDELRAWGHPGGESGHIILKSDGEQAIVALRDSLAKYHGGKVVPESPPRGESASNGAVESAGKLVREFVRVLKEQVEHSAQLDLGTTDVLTLWMVRWAAMLCSRYLVGKDGLTAYQRRRGRNCHIPVVIFGEKVWYKQIRASKERKDKFESEWQEGIWLGHRRNTNEHVIGTRDGAVRAYAIKRKDASQRWDATLLKEIRGTPEQPNPHKPGSAIPIRINFDPPAERPPQVEEPLIRARQVRRMKITSCMLEQFGYTEGCDGCRYKQAGFEESRNHSEQCRTRIEDAMTATEEGRRAKQRQDERINHALAQHLEQADRQRAEGDDVVLQVDAQPDADMTVGDAEDADMEGGTHELRQEGGHAQASDIILQDGGGDSLSFLDLSVGNSARMPSGRTS